MLDGDPPRVEHAPGLPQARAPGKHLSRARSRRDTGPTPVLPWAAAGTLHGSKSPEPPDHQTTRPRCGLCSPRRIDVLGGRVPSGRVRARLGHLDLHRFRPSLAAGRSHAVSLRWNVASDAPRASGFRRRRELRLPPGRPRRWGPEPGGPSSLCSRQSDRHDLPVLARRRSRVRDHAGRAEHALSRRLEPFAVPRQHAGSPAFDGP